MDYKQVIVVNKGLNMSKGKLSAQVSHGSMAFLSWQIRNNASFCYTNHYRIDFILEGDIFNNWMSGSFTKVILAVECEEELKDIVRIAKERDMTEGKDFFCIRDNCLTELKPDETGTRWTCIGFKPMRSKDVDLITGKLRLYR